MQKVDILFELETAKMLYKNALSFDTHRVPELFGKLGADCINKGFCLYFRFQATHFTSILQELEKEKPADTYSFWYTSPSSIMLQSVADIKQFALQPRLDHLTRTIARLEAELQSTVKTVRDVREIDVIIEHVTAK